MRVSLVTIEPRANVWRRFGQPSSTVLLDAWRRVATFKPGQLCCRIRWLRNDFGRALWSAVVLQAPCVDEGMQRMAGVTPGARILVRANGERPVKSLLSLVDEIEA